MLNSFTATHSNKLAIKLSRKIPPHLKRVATLPCYFSSVAVRVSDYRSLDIGVFF